MHTHGDIKNPSLIFLHGFLGSEADWDPLIAQLKDRFYCVTLPLGPVATVEKAIHALQLHSPTYIGYSMGGRVALQLPAMPSILLSAHVGLDTQEEKAVRWEEDLRWIHLLETAPIEVFLQEWYAQPLFQLLRNKKQLFEQMLQRRLKQDPIELASLLRQQSLAHQEKITHFHPCTLFLFGEEDWKYQQLYDKLPHNVQRIKIPAASHAIHLENPDACAQIIKEWSPSHANNPRTTNN